jgi:hypothetical protein
MTSTLAEIEAAIMDALRTAREPVAEAVLYERVRTRGVSVAPGAFMDVAERLATEGQVHVAFEHELPTSPPPPFEARYYRVVE